MISVKSLSLNAQNFSRNEVHKIISSKASSIWITKISAKTRKLVAGHQNFFIKVLNINSFVLKLGPTALRMCILSYTQQ
jgi:hypothetical protein